MSFKLEIGDGIFYSLISIIILVLFWMRYLEKYLSLWWIQQLKLFYRKQGFIEGIAYIDSWNKGVLKSVLRAGYQVKK